MEKELKVAALKDGTVIDHIPAHKLFQVVSILNLKGFENQVTIGNNLESKLLKRKGIIKIAGRFLLDAETNKIALFAPNAKINIIRDYKVHEKRALSLPEEIKNFVLCANPKCITNHQPVQTHFELEKEEDENHRLKCRYCEREMMISEVKLK